MAYIDVKVTESNKTGVMSPSSQSLYHIVYDHNGIHLLDSDILIADFYNKKDAEKILKIILKNS